MCICIILHNSDKHQKLHGLWMVSLSDKFLQMQCSKKCGAHAPRSSGIKAWGWCRQQQGDFLHHCRTAGLTWGLHPCACSLSEVHPAAEALLSLPPALPTVVAITSLRGNEVTAVTGRASEKPPVRQRGLETTPGEGWTGSSRNPCISLQIATVRGLQTRLWLAVPCSRWTEVGLGSVECSEF